MSWDDDKSNVLNEGYQGGKGSFAQDGHPFTTNERGYQGGNPDGCDVPPSPPKRQPKDGDE